MERSSFFNSVNGDRKYKAERFADYFASFIGNGIFLNPSDCLKVIAGEGMNIILRPGKAWINGYMYENTGDLIKPIDTADGILKRIDRVVVRWSLTDRDMYSYIKKGTPASNPQPPAIQRDADIWELALADVTVNQGATEISQVADLRYNAELCGQVAHVIQDLDLTDFYEECSRKMLEQVDAWQNQTDAQQEAWLLQMQEQADMIGQIAGQINVLYDDYYGWKGSIDAWKGMTVTELAEMVSFYFDNQMALPGTVKTMPVYSNNMLTLQIRTAFDDRLVAD